MLLTSYTAESLTPESVTAMLRASGRYDELTVETVDVSAIEPANQPLEKTRESTSPWMRSNGRPSMKIG